MFKDAAALVIMVACVFTGYASCFLLVAVGSSNRNGGSVRHVWNRGRTSIYSCFSWIYTGSCICLRFRRAAKTFGRLIDIPGCVYDGMHAIFVYM